MQDVQQFNAAAVVKKETVFMAFFYPALNGKNWKKASTFALHAEMKEKKRLKLKD